MGLKIDFKFEILRILVKNTYGGRPSFVQKQSGWEAFFGNITRQSRTVGVLIVMNEFKITEDGMPLFVQNLGR